MTAQEGLRQAGVRAAPAAVMLLWGLNLGYPMPLLQPIRWTLFGHMLPVYYILTAGLMLGAAAWVLAAKRDWTRWELLWCLLPLICLPGMAHSGEPLWSARQWLSWMVRGPIPGGILFLTARRRGPEPWLLRWVFPIAVAASLLGLAELACDRNPLWDHPPLAAEGRARPGDDFSAAVHRLDVSVIPRSSRPGNPFYRPYRSLFLSSRPWGTQGNKVPYAATILAFFPLGLCLLKRRPRFYWARLAAAAAVFSLLLLARARSAWVGLLAVMLALPAVGLQRDKRELMKVAAGMLLCLGLILAWPKGQAMLRDRVRSFRFAEQSIRERLVVLKTARALRGRWLTGVGFGQFPTACRPFHDETLPWLGTPDNQYLRWTIENGVLGLGLLAAFVIGLTRAGWRRVRLMADPGQADLYRAILAGWLGIAVTFLFFDGFYWGACNMTFWCLLGLFAAGLKVPADGDGVISPGAAAGSAPTTPSAAGACGSSAAARPG